VANRFLTAFQNALTGAKLSEYHTGYRAFSRNVLQVLPYSKTPTIFVFDNEVLRSAFGLKFRLGEVSCPTNTSKRRLRLISGEASSTVWEF